MRSHRHQAATEEAFNFMRLRKNPEENVVGQNNANYRATTELNRLILNSLLKVIPLCVMHDIALRGNTAKSGILYDLYEFMLWNSLCGLFRKNLSFHEEFLGFSALKAMNAACRNFKSKNLERNRKVWAGNTETSGTRLRCFFLQWLERSEVCNSELEIYALKLTYALCVSSVKSCS